MFASVVLAATPHADGVTAGQHLGFDRSNGNGHFLIPAQLDDWRRGDGLEAP